MIDRKNYLLLIPTPKISVGIANAASSIFFSWSRQQEHSLSITLCLSLVHAQHSFVFSGNGNVRTGDRVGKFGFVASIVVTLWWGGTIVNAGVSGTKRMLHGIALTRDREQFFFCWKFRNGEKGRENWEMRFWTW